MSFYLTSTKISNHFSTYLTSQYTEPSLTTQQTTYLSTTHLTTYKNQTSFEIASTKSNSNNKQKSTYSIYLKTFLPIGIIILLMSFSLILFFLIKQNKYFKKSLLNFIYKKNRESIEIKIEN